jgi:hypothetical protein
MKPVGLALTRAQVDWLYQVSAEAARDRRRVSHSELVRLAIDQLRARDPDPGVEGSARIAELGDLVAGEQASYALTGEQQAWLRVIQGRALIAGHSASQAHVVRAAVQALVGTSWAELQARGLLD